MYISLSSSLKQRVRHCRAPSPLLNYMSTMREPRSPSGDPTLLAPVPTIHEACYRHLYRSQKKLTIHESHLSFINACLRNSLTPKGLTIKTVPTIENTGPGRQLWTVWKHILRKSSTLLMQTLKRYHCSQRDHQLYNIEQAERTLLRRSNFDTNKMAILGAMTRMQSELELRKKR